MAFDGSELSVLQDILSALGGAGTPTAYSTESNSTITTGGSAQNVLAANSTRSRLKIQNLSSGDMWIRTGGAAAIGTGMWLPSGSFYEWPSHDMPPGAVSVIGATTGQAYFIAEG